MKSVFRATFQGGLRIVSELLSCLDKLSASVKKKRIPTLSLAHVNNHDLSCSFQSLMRQIYFLLGMACQIFGEDLLDCAREVTFDSRETEIRGHV